MAYRIVVLNEGKVEQVGHADRALRAPGERVRDELRRAGQPRSATDLVRPHDLVIITATPRPGSIAAKVERVLRLGFEVRVELCVNEEEPASVQLSASEAEPLDLEAGQMVYLSVARKPALAESPAPAQPA